MGELFWFADGRGVRLRVPRRAAAGVRMSPIRASERSRYPADWPLISAEIRYGRAESRCECDGRCGSPRCGIHLDSPLHKRRRCAVLNGADNPMTGSRVVLTVAHLDHQPENCDPDNLLAMCQACHLAYDREHHAATRAARRGEVPT